MQPSEIQLPADCAQHSEWWHELACHAPEIAESLNSLGTGALVIVGGVILYFIIKAAKNGNGNGNGKHWMTKEDGQRLREDMRKDGQEREARNKEGIAAVGRSVDEVKKDISEIKMILLKKEA